MENLSLGSKVLRPFHTFERNGSLNSAEFLASSEVISFFLESRKVVRYKDSK